MGGGWRVNTQGPRTEINYKSALPDAENVPKVRRELFSRSNSELAPAKGTCLNFEKTLLVEQVIKNSLSFLLLIPKISDGFLKLQNEAATAHKLSVRFSHTICYKF